MFYSGSRIPKAWAQTWGLYYSCALKSFWSQKLLRCCRWQELWKWFTLTTCLSEKLKPDPAARGRQIQSSPSSLLMPILTVTLHAGIFLQIQLSDTAKCGPWSEESVSPPKIMSFVRKRSLFYCHGTAWCCLSCQAISIYLLNKWMN